MTSGSTITSSRTCRAKRPKRLSSYTATTHRNALSRRFGSRVRCGVGVIHLGLPVPHSVRHGFRRALPSLTTTELSCRQRL